MPPARKPPATRHAPAARRGGALGRAAAAVLIALVYLYRGTLGPLLGGHCRFQPTCSQYMIDAIRKHGPLRGTARGLWRIARCNPWGGCGYDPA